MRVGLPDPPTGVLWHSPLFKSIEIDMMGEFAPMMSAFKEDL
jgi:hypothetical protein